VSARSASAEPYEGLFVEVRNLTVVSVSGDGRTVELTEGVLLYNRFYLPAPRPPVGATVVRVAGVVEQYGDTYELLPRLAGDLEVVIRDAGAGDARPDVPLPDGPVACTAVRVNEVATQGSAGATWEFVELVGPPGFDLTGYQLVYRSGTATGDSRTLVGASAWTTTAIPESGYYLVTGSAVADLTGNATFASGATGQLGANSGGVGLRNPAGDLVDSVAWGSTGNVPANGFLEGGTYAPNPDRSSSIARRRACYDTNDTAADFATGTPTPGH
jgi:hypothetical protein